MTDKIYGTYKVKDLINQYEEKSKCNNYNVLSNSMINIGSYRSQSKIFVDNNFVSYTERNRLQSITQQRLKHIFEDITKLRARIKKNDVNQVSYMGKINEIIFLFSELVEIESDGNKCIFNEKGHLLTMLQNIYFDITKPFLSKLSDEINRNAEDETEQSSPALKVNNDIIVDKPKLRINSNQMPAKNNVQALKNFYESKIEKAQFETVKPNLVFERKLPIYDYSESNSLSSEDFLWQGGNDESTPLQGSVESLNKNYFDDDSSTEFDNILEAQTENDDESTDFEYYEIKGSQAERMVVK